MMTVKLSDIAEVIAGQSPPSESYNQDGKGIPFFQGKADFNEMFPTVRYWCESPIKFSLPNDILFSLRAPVGPTNVNNVKACIGRGIAAIRCKDSVDLKFLLHFLRANENKIAALGTGSTFKAITIGVLKDLQIPLPPLSEQKRIAELLDAADTLRKKDKALLEKYDQLAQSLFLEMFGDPVKNEKGWAHEKFTSFVDDKCPLAYGIVQPGEEVDDGIPIVRPVDFDSKYIDIKRLKRILPEISEQFNRTKLRGDELLITVRGTIGLVAFATPDLKGCNVTRGVVPIWLNSDSKLTIQFLYYLLSNKSLNQFIDGLAKGATLRGLNLNDLRNIEVISPPIHLQNQFTEQVQLIERQKEIAKKNLEKSEELMKGLMGEVFG